MATKRQKLFLSFFLTRAGLFGFGYSRMYAISKSDTWLSAVLGMLFGIIIIYMISKILESKKSNTLTDYFKKKPISKLTVLLLSAFLIVKEITTLVNFMTSFFLLNTPGYIIGGCAIIVSLYIISKGFNSILRTSEIVFYISLILTIPTLLILSSYSDLSNIMPILSISYHRIIKSSLIFALYTSIPMTLLLNLDNDGTSLIKMYIFNCLTVIILILIILLIFGPELTCILRFPEYIVLKRIKVLSFIEKIESILSVTYIFDNIFLLIISIYTIKVFTYKDDNKTIFYIIITAIYIITCILIIGNYINALSSYYITPYILSIGLLPIISNYIKTLKKKPKLQIQRDT